jgi:hypothetical protein
LSTFFEVIEKLLGRSRARRQRFGLPHRPNGSGVRLADLEGQASVCDNLLEEDADGAAQLQAGIGEDPRDFILQGGFEAQAHVGGFRGGDHGRLHA